MLDHVERLARMEAVALDEVLEAVREDAAQAQLVGELLQRREQRPELEAAPALVRGTLDVGEAAHAGLQRGELLDQIALLGGETRGERVRIARHRQLHAASSIIERF